MTKPPSFLSKRRTMLMAAVAAPLAVAGLGRAAAGPAPKTIRISAKKFQFIPAEVKLKRGEEVILELSTQDVLMGFSLPDFKTRADLVPGKTQTLRITPDKTGEFVFLCDVFCGSGHEDMSGKLIVT
ncbi:cupredoxin domain-containing protein [Undibacterium sp. TJN25]|uniref:cupredoxin domain-containing protein n=1 Tax=Undibacterium sp. TJN25 TaxID=3413056 RepID=UPI003BF29332